MNVHQMLVGVMPQDAITEHAFTLREALRDWGYTSQIYTKGIHPALSREVLLYTRYRPRQGDRDILIFHYSTGSGVSDYVRSLPVRLIMLYHNVTPAEYFRDIDRQYFEEAAKGRAELEALKDAVDLALADSEFSRQELERCGYPRTGVLPIFLDEERYSRPPDQAVLDAFQGDGYTNLLFVGRIVPNKKQEDVIKVFYYYKRINPRSRLFLVGPVRDRARPYRRWLESVAAHLHLPDVHFCGPVPFEALVAYYRLADVFVCMSEHEGFCKPLVESMYFDVPIIAYDAAAVPYTLGETGVLVKEKRYQVVAEMINLLVTDADLRQRIVARQRERLRRFLKSSVLAIFKEYITDYEFRGRE